MTAFFHKYYMNLAELNNFSLSDAVKFHDKLNPSLFDGDKLKKDVREQLLVIAEDFIEHLGIKHLDIEDITISGSNAAYSYTSHSDVDLHILVNMDKYSNDDVYRELFDAKKTVYNENHDIIINGYEVELYVQDTNQPVISLGEYSVLNNSWIKLPRKRRANIDQIATKLKYKKLYDLCKYAYKSKDLKKVDNILKTIKKYRQAGLDKHGEFGPENLAYKIMRTKGYIKKLYDLRDKLHSEKLSLENINEDINEIHNYKKLDKVLTKLCRMIVKGQLSNKDYGMVAACVIDNDNNIVAGLNSPDSNGKRIHAERVAIEKYIDQYGNIPQGSIVVTTLSPCNELNDKTAVDRYGINCTEYLNDKGIKKVYCGYIDPTQDNDIREFNLIETSDKDIRNECKKFADTFLVNETVNRKIFDDPIHSLPMFGTKPVKLGDYMYDARTFSGSRTHGPDALGLQIRAYDPKKPKNYGSIASADFIVVTDKKGNSWLESDDTDVDLDYRGEGIAKMMYFFAKSLGNDIKPSSYQNTSGYEMWDKWHDKKYLMKEASGYIPSEKEKNDSRYKTALTVDIHPDTMKVNAKKLGWNIKRNGIPPTLRA